MGMIEMRESGGYFFVARTATGTIISSRETPPCANILTGPASRLKPLLGAGPK
jgi:hypothetical protein